ncbi:hypothetical protein MBLNU459_g1566t1 [Dothideomycetes sp. NU459]
MSVKWFITLGTLACSLVAAAPNQGVSVKTETVTKTETKTITSYDHKTTVTAYKTIANCSSASTTVISSVNNAASTTSTVSNTDGSTTLTATATGTKGLSDYAIAAGKKYFGTACDIPGTNETTDKYYLAELNNTHDFHQITPGNAIKWVNTEPEQNVFNYTQADINFAIAEANGQLVRCHNLNWYNQLPNWLTSGTWTNATLIAVLQNHIDNLVTYFGDKCYAWDVVNEALNDTSSGDLDDPYTWRQDIWYETIGPDFVNIAFQAAEAAVKRNNLTVKLYYNDYNIEYPGNKSTAAQALVKRLKDAGTQIDGVGLQSHFIVGETPSTASQVQNMNAFVDLDVEVAITELDIRTTLPPTDAAELQQVQDFKSTVQACADVAKCVGITVWDFDDTYSWIPSTFAGQGYGNLFLQPGGQDTHLVKKAAYDGVIAGFTNTTVIT